MVASRRLPWIALAVLSTGAAPDEPTLRVDFLGVPDPVYDRFRLTSIHEQLMVRAMEEGFAVVDARAEADLDLLLHYRDESFTLVLRRAGAEWRRQVAVRNDVPAVHLELLHKSTMLLRRAHELPGAGDTRSNGTVDGAVSTAPDTAADAPRAPSAPERARAPETTAAHPERTPPAVREAANSDASRPEAATAQPNTNAPGPSGVAKAGEPAEALVERSDRVNSAVLSVRASGQAHAAFAFPSAGARLGGLLEHRSGWGAGLVGQFDRAFRIAERLSLWEWSVAAMVSYARASPSGLLWRVVVDLGVNDQRSHVSGRPTRSRVDPVVRVAASVGWELSPTWCVELFAGARFLPATREHRSEDELLAEIPAIRVLGGMTLVYSFVRW